jgi:lysophospholipase
MVILHGTSEYGGRYDHVARVAVEQGWNVIAPDLRGHGHSGGAPVHTDRFERYLTDLDAIWTHFKLNPDRTVLVGHSFGGLVSIRFAQTRPTRLQALVLSSPLLGLLVKIGSLKLALGRLASILRPETRFRSTVPPEHTCHDPEVLSRRMADPLMHRSITAAWFFQMKRALHDAWKDAARLEIPILALQAGDDLIVDPAAVEPWIQTTATRDPVFRMITGAYHEVFNEPDWRDTLDETLTWLDELVPCVTAEG